MLVARPSAIMGAMPAANVPAANVTAANVTAANVTVVDHPAVTHRVAELRDAATVPDRFRTVLAELSALVAYEALRHLPTSPVEVTTPLAVAPGRVVTEHLLIVPILRAGLGMVPGIQSVIPETEVAHLGMRRDEETLAAVTYLDRLPADLTGRRVVVCDPMLATGGSLAQGVRLVAERGATDIVALCILAAAPGTERFSAEFPDVPVTCAALDPALDGRGFIVPGLGDAGDRLFGPPPA
jgi:uracil phosphoribosyltransferase